jgi:hypothetical protein
MTKRWPAAEAAQVDYETLREAAVRHRPLVGPAAARFERGGLAAVIIRPVAPPVFSAVITGAARPPWSPYSDPRSEAIIAVYGLLVAAELAEIEEATS